MSLILIGCDSSEETSLTTGTSTLSVKLMDEPGDYDNVFIEVLDVKVKVNDSNDDENGWQSLETINTGVYDLLELTGGINVLLVDDYEIPSGVLNQIRLILGENNTIVIDGEEFPLRTPSAQQSGLKLIVNETLESNYSYTFLLDFDVDESIVMAGNSGNINLKPVIRATVETSTGAISGSITPIDVQTEVSVSNGSETISSFTNENGNFILVGLTQGTYSVTITPDTSSGFTTQTIENVEVNIGETTDIGDISLN
ncbi:MAG: DUF4382 domain-containing protein [Flavobacteriaceae bacterium]|nr:DUF4382 domain-containing protein [Bacteroidia bacterium]NNL15522.1 DUF4382 domain-containing protein [Flavobacteriaceae bacterium]